MKSIKRYFFVMMAVAAVFGFVACSDDDDGASAVAVYKDDTVNTVTFYDNDTFEVIMEVPSLSYTETEAEGTYTGDPSKDGEITMTYTFINGFDYNKDWYEAAGIALNKAVTVKITSGKCYVLGSAYTRQK